MIQTTPENVEKINHRIGEIVKEKLGQFTEDTKDGSFCMSDEDFVEFAANLYSHLIVSELAGYDTYTMLVEAETKSKKLQQLTQEMEEDACIS